MKKDKKRNDKESMICLMPKPNQSFFVYHIQSKEIFLQKKSFLRKRGSGSLKTAIEEEWNKMFEEFILNANCFECLLIQ